MMRTLCIDIETYSSVSLPDCGVHKYAASPDFEILLLAYAFNNDEVTVVDFTAGETLPEHVLDALWSPDVLKTAFNASFERTCIARYFRWPCDPEQWECDMVLASTCGLPMKLEEVGRALQFGEDKAKMKEGKELIRYFCVPCRPTKTNGGRTRNMPSDAPEKWDLFKAYNKRDVETEREIRRLLLRWRPSEIERRFWALDQRINDNGIRVDPTLVDNAIEMDARYKAELTERAIELSGLENPSSVAQVKNWLHEQEGVYVPSLNKKVVADVVANLSSERSKEFMKIRAELSKTSTKKYDAMRRVATSDDHVKGCFQFAGAGRTGRFAGRHVQLQNLAQNHLPDLAEARALVRAGDYETVRLLYGGVSSTLSELIRTALIPEEGHQFLVADFSAIEARVVAWIAGEQWTLDTFEQGGDIYCATASQMFGVPVEKHGANKELRQKGKIATLACGYGGGVAALKAFGADKMGMTEETMVDTVDRWRAANTHIVALWKSLERAAIRCVVHRTPTCSTIGNIRFDFEKGVLWMTLPSGRRIAYWGAEYTEGSRGKKCLTYLGTEQTTRRWTRLETWGGKLVENCVQATARDCLRDAMLALDAAGFDIRAHIHDECVATEPIGGRTVEEMAEIMGRPLDWAPGLPLRADGYACDFYKKD